MGKRRELWRVKTVSEQYYVRSTDFRSRAAALGAFASHYHDNAAFEPLLTFMYRVTGPKRNETEELLLAYDANGLALNTAVYATSRGI